MFAKHKVSAENGRDALLGAIRQSRAEAEQWDDRDVSLWMMSVCVLQEDPVDADRLLLVRVTKAAGGVGKTVSENCQKCSSFMRATSDERDCRWWMVVER